MKNKLPLPKKFHINVENLTAKEQLGLLSVIFHYYVDKLSSDKIILLEIEK